MKDVLVARRRAEEHGCRGTLCGRVLSAPL
jgi:predicted transcriptional regulator